MRPHDAPSRTRLSVALVFVALASPGVLAAGEGPSVASVAVDDIAFEVTNPLDPFQTHTLPGALFRPASAPACDASVLLLLHGFTYDGPSTWDFPYKPETYSMARALASQGFPVAIVTQYGTPPLPGLEGYRITLEGLAAMAHQMVLDLKEGTYLGDAPTGFQHVGIGGHSMGGSTAQHAAALYGDVSVLVAMAVTQVAQPELTPEQAVDFFTAAATQPYVTLDPDLRTYLFYDADLTEPGVPEIDNAASHPGSSTQMFTTAFATPNRLLLPLIDVPVMLVLAENDRIYSIDHADAELASYAGSPDKTLHIIPDAGHSFMLHTNAPQTNQAIVDWLDARPHAMPAC